MEKFCVACDCRTDNGKSVCYECALINRVSVDYVPTVCGDDVCYLDHQGMPNFDGACGHWKLFDSIIQFR